MELSSCFKQSMNPDRQPCSAIHYLKRSCFSDTWARMSATVAAGQCLSSQDWSDVGIKSMMQAGDDKSLNTEALNPKPRNPQPLSLKL